VGVAAQLPGDTGPALFDAAREAVIRGMQLTVTLSAVAAACIAVLTTVLLRMVPAPAQAETGKQPAAPPESEVVTEPEEPIQIIWVGSGCLACPGERLPSQVEGWKPHHALHELVKTASGYRKPTHLSDLGILADQAADAGPPPEG
jgi:hypothetical protein